MSNEINNELLEAIKAYLKAENEFANDGSLPFYCKFTGAEAWLNKAIARAESTVKAVKREEGDEII